MAEVLQMPLERLCEALDANTDAAFAVPGRLNQTAHW
jgi:hypothetical protein